jgi:hypothetical protein
MDPPQPLHVEGPFEPIDNQHMSNQRRDSGAPYEAFDKTQKGCRNEKDYATVLFNEFADVQGKPMLDEYTLESNQEVDETGKLLIHTTFQEFATCVKELKKKCGNTDEPLSPKYMQKAICDVKSHSWCEI